MSPNPPSSAEFPGGASSQAFLVACRDRAAERLAAILDPALDAAAEALLDTATRTTDPDTRGQYLHAVDQARAGHIAFREGVRIGVIDRFATLSGGARPRPDDTHLDIGALTLVRTGTLENEIAIGNLALRLKDEAREELFSFTRRVGALTGQPDLLEQDNPIGPSALACGLYGGIARLTLREKAVRTFANLVANHLAGAVRTLYGELDAMLAEHGVKGAGRARILKSESQSAHKSAHPVAQGAASPEDMLAHLQLLLAQQRAPGGAGAPTPGQPGLGWAGVLPAGGAPGAGTPLGQLGFGRSGALPAGSAPVMATPAMVDWLTEVQRGAIPIAGEGADGGATAGIPATGGAVNVLRGLRQSDAGRRFADADGTTCDLVAMIFDQVFGDPRIPDAFKALLARLQIPTLKAAMLDRGFFSDTAHPARRLLDRLGAAAVGWHGSAGAADPFYAGVAGIVQRAIESFGADLAELEALTAEAEALAGQEADRSEEIAGRSIELIAARERVALAGDAAADAIEARLAAEPGPAPVRAVLRDQWREVLAAIFAREGADGESWRAAMQTMDDLLWSVKPKSGAAERAQLVKMLPGLIGRLGTGLERAGLSVEARRQALDALVPLHADAVRPAASQHAPAPAPEPPHIDTRSVDIPLDADPAEPPQIESVTLTRDDLVVEAVEIKGRPASKAGALAGSIPGLVRGTWVEFAQPDGSSLRARLSWVSPLKGVHVFVNPSATRSLAFDPEALAEAIRRGDARVLSDAPLVEAAMGRVMSELEQAHGAG